MKYKEPKVTNKPFITRKQQKELRKLGYRCNSNIRSNFFVDFIDYSSYTKSCDGVIDWLRKKFHIIIYNSIEPFVDPCNESRDILFRFSVKYCNIRDGWNGRKYIGQSKLTKNIYAAKRQAITLAIRWLNKNNYGKKKNISSRSNNHNKK